MPALPIRRRTTSLGCAESVRIEEDEYGFLLYLDTDEGPFVVNVHGVLDELLSQIVPIVDYVNEREDARVSRPLRDDADAYPADDPKHPDWHSVHADLYDSRDSGKRSM